MNPILDRINFSPIAEIVSLAARRGGDTIHLEIGDVNYPLPTLPLTATQEIVSLKASTYPPFGGFAELRDLAAQRLRDRHHLEASEEELIITAGGAIGLYAALLSAAASGDEVLVFDPCWPHNLEIVRLVGATPIVCPLRADDYQIDVASLEERVTPRTKVLFVNSPHNPTATVLTETSIRAIVDFAGRHNLVVVSDEEYDAFVFGDQRHHSPRAWYPETISVFSFSKTLAMAGYRLGFLLAPARCMNSIRKILLYTTMYPSAAAQILAVNLMKYSPGFERDLVAAYQSRADWATKMMSHIPGVCCPFPQGTPYLWADISRCVPSSEQFAKQLLVAAGVAVVPGVAFGALGEGKVRISTGQPEELLREGLMRFGAFCTERQSSS